MDNATVNYAVALIQTNRHGEAAELLERNLHRFPYWAEARLNLGIAYAGAGNLPAARRELAALPAPQPRPGPSPRRPDPAGRRQLAQ